MPIDDQLIRRTVICERCFEPGIYQLDIRSGHFSYECACCQLEANDIHTLRGPGELRACTHHGAIRALRPSNRIVLNTRGRVFRQLWFSPAGTILQAGLDFAVVHTQEGGRTTWHTDFAGAYFELTNEIWKDDQ
jgi:hypothetical protein